MPAKILAAICMSGMMLKSPVRRGVVQSFPKALSAVFGLNGIMDAHRKQQNVDGTDCSLIERIERALLLLAYLIELDGDVHVPMYEKFESELAELKAVADVKARASRRLAAYRESGTRKAICAKNLSFNSSEGPLPYLGL
jgi:hypothetical protein